MHKQLDTHIQTDKQTDGRTLYPSCKQNYWITNDEKSFDQQQNISTLQSQATTGNT